MNMQGPTNRITGRYDQNYAFILLAALVAHGLMLLNDGLYWDDWLLYSDLVGRRWENIRATFAEAGIPTTMYFHWWMGHLPTILFSYRLLAVVAIIIAGLTVYRISLDLGWLSRSESLIIALTSVTYPAMQVSFELINVPSVVSYALFLVAALAAMRAERQVSTFHHYALRLTALLLFILVFTVPSLLVFYFGFLLLLALYARRSKNLRWQDLFTTFALRRLDFLMLPFIWWFAKQYLFPKHGLYAAYNNFNLTPRSVVYSYLGFLKYGIIGQFLDAIMALVRHPILSVLFIVSIQLAYWFWNIGSLKFSDSRTKSLAVIGFGMLLFALGSFPYVAVGLWPALHGWDTRHALLLALPVGIIIAGGYGLVTAAQFPFAKRLGFTCVMLLLAGFTLAIFDDYISWQARWVKDRSVMINLRRSNEAQSNQVFWIDDQFPEGQQDFYRFYEWSSMFKTVWGNESRIGIDPRQYPRDFLTKNTQFFTGRYNLSNFDPQGCQATLTIRQGVSASSDTAVVFRYLSDKFFRQQEVDDFLRGVTDLQLQRIESMQAVHCPPR